MGWARSAPGHIWECFRDGANRRSTWRQHDGRVIFEQNSPLCAALYQIPPGLNGWKEMPSPCRGGLNSRQDLPRRYARQREGFI